MREPNTVPPETSDGLPCRCGEVHTGPYAVYDWGHHNCFHDEPLIQIMDKCPGYLMCPSCGKVFWEKEALEKLRANRSP